MESALTFLLLVSIATNAAFAWLFWQEKVKKPTEPDDQFDEDELVMYGAVENSRA